ncbi:MAG: SpoIIE family protein phosphatase [Acidobacteriota bacterium]|nr:SpoIIE family protein phosphatase [Acidobacteriota bacterium]MDH3529679.1 SpoIIE family protein phosphatase [Acidobacteriota bacterium]
MDKNPKKDSRATEKDSLVADILLLKDRALDVAAEGITIADMRLPDQPLIYINEGFERLTGYSAKSMFGKNCRFLQGADTDQDTVRQISEALANGTECTVEILNQTKDGRPFWNRLSLTPVTDSLGEVTHFIGVQSDITKRKNAETALREANQKLERANRHMKRNLDAAAKIQRSLLPDSAPVSDDVMFSWVFQPCDELAGDTLNVFPLDEKRFAVYMIDVSGHGVSASLLSVTLSHWFSRHFQISGNSGGEPQTDSISFSSPLAVAEELNRQFQMDAENAQYFTMCFGVIDVDAGEFRYVAAGCPPVIVAGKEGNSDIRVVEGFPVGIVDQPEYSENVIKLDSGDRVFLYTDGVTEAEDRNDNPYGTELMAQNILKNGDRELEDCLGAVMESVTAWRGDRSLDDDVSILAFELT